MRSPLTHVALVTSILIVGFGAVSASPSSAQTRVTSLEELRRELATGDVITVVPSGGQPVKGRLVRLGRDDLDVRPVKGSASPERGLKDVTIALDAIQSLRRPRDSARNGAMIGAGIGAGFTGAMFIQAMVVDRNEAEEWAPLFLGFGGVTTGIGALIGWAVDAAHSKPDIRFDASPMRQTKVSVHPVFSRGRGIGLAVSFSR